MVAEKRFTSAREQFIVSRSVPRNARVQRLSATDGPFTRLASRSTLLPSPGAARAVGAPNSHRLGGAHCLPRSSLCRKARIWIGCCSARLLAWRSPSSGLPTFCGRRTSLFQDSYWPETLRALPIFAICTCLRCAFPQSNHGRTPETCRRLDAPRLGISEGFQRGPRPTSEKAGKVPG